MRGMGHGAWHQLINIHHTASRSMGGGRDKRKKAKPKTPGAGAEKTARKTQKNEAKAEQRVLKKAQVTCSLFSRDT
jgi:hypothetical protein